LIIRVDVTSPPSEIKRATRSTRLQLTSAESILNAINRFMQRFACWVHPLQRLVPG